MSQWLSISSPHNKKGEAFLYGAATLGVVAGMGALAMRQQKFDIQNLFARPELQEYKATASKDIPTVLVHGFGGSGEVVVTSGEDIQYHDPNLEKGKLINSWEWWETKMANEGYKVSAPSLIPNMGNIDMLSNQLADHIDTIQKKYNASKVNLICHSLGCVTARNYLVGNRFNDNVNKMVMIGGPNRGSYIAALGYKALPIIQKINYSVPNINFLTKLLKKDSPAATQVAKGSEWINSLNAKQLPAGVKYMCISSDWIPMINVSTDGLIFLFETDVPKPHMSVDAGALGTDDVYPIPNVRFPNIDHWKLNDQEEIYDYVTQRL